MCLLDCFDLGGARIHVGRYADGLGKVRNEPDRTDFRPQPVDDMGIWMLSQLKRWGYIKGDMNYKTIVDSVFHSEEAQTRVAALNVDIVPAIDTVTIMGKLFDAARP
ncbi:hypothetical protein [Rhizobium herbae]